MEEPGPVNDGLLLTGATGFIGRAVLENLRRRDDVPRARLLLHHRAPDPAAPASYEAVYADLASPETLAGVCDGVDTVLHIATYIGDDRDRLEAVNARGTEALVSLARAAGIRRFLYVSNAALYGYAVHRNAKETDVAVNPASPISLSRARAERAVLERGGLVLRPLFIYGAGDTHFLPVIIRTLNRFPFLINGGRARLSVISADDFAAALVALVTDRSPRPLRGVCHVNDGHPVSLREIVWALADCFGSRRPLMGLPLSVAQHALRWSGRSAFPKASQESLKHRLYLIAEDHYYDSTKLWDMIGARPGPPLPMQLAKYSGWYSRFLSQGSERRRTWL